MSVDIRNQLVSSRDKTWGGGNKCTSITIHETANTSRGANAQAHANLQSNGNVRQASWHIQVDDSGAIRSFPDDVKCWHATRKGEDSIAIEICVNSDGDYNKALDNAADVVRQLREKHNLGRAAVVDHHHWTGKDCPRNLRSRGGFSSFVASTDPGGASSTPTKSDSSGKSIPQMATEVLNGQHGNGHDNRRRSLGVNNDIYQLVRAEVNRRAGSSTPSRPPSSRKSVSQMASEVIDGKHGTGHDTRRRSLGVSQSIYNQVRAEVNRRYGVTVGPKRRKSVPQMAAEVIRGEHGEGHTARQKSLGVSSGVYRQVRAEVNRRM